ncbi:hypothetical protein JCM33374_g2987 [Metschnikowia sp. JCM 33374]|nr:hypothetical protein JCM33374_g2987 [Metschnikowia sp. JCM 33374]
MDELLARHRKEQKDLVGQITAMKKQASKKTRKSVNSKCADLQSSLDARHAKEIAELDGSAATDPQEVSPEQLLAAMSLDASAKESDTTGDENGVKFSQSAQSGNSDAQEAPVTPEAAPQAGKKRNRAKERLAKRQAQIEAIQAEAHEEASNSVDYRAIEAESMRQLLHAQGLSLHEIKPDGHCLFSSIQDQLLLRHEPLDESSTLSVSQLRKQAADHIRENPDSYIPYLFDQETMTLRDVGHYTKELEETAMWGSDLEIAALAAVYDCPIKVLVAGSAPIVFNEVGTRPQLIVAYFKHSYGLGEHYNSCRDIIEDARV